MDDSKNFKTAYHQSPLGLCLGVCTLPPEKGNTISYNFLIKLGPRHLIYLVIF